MHPVPPLHVQALVVFVFRQIEHRQWFWALQVPLPLLPDRPSQTIG
jgi:hypothetical protein